jgi:hypothetical protein
LRQYFQWPQITTRLDRSKSIVQACSSKDCPCSLEGTRPGEEFHVVPETVQDCLKSFGERPDQLLFESLIEAALSVEEGSVWRAGGKLIFSAFNRNQAVSNLVRMLQNNRHDRCAKMILQLAAHSEKAYGGLVTACQVNFHPHKDTYHDQHRDIYSAKQRAGPNCACSFREAVGTVCYSLGSSRICQLETMTDDHSPLEKCCEECPGRREHHWLHSGSAMWFNGDWNTNHTHGIPKLPETTGPRISIAFLMGAPNLKNSHISLGV